MKILPAPLIRQADAYTIEHEPIAGIDLMERAATACAGWLCTSITPGRKVMIFCGTGNNGGDGLAIARLLFLRGYEVEAHVMKPAGKLSEDFRNNFERLFECRNSGMQECRNADNTGNSMVRGWIRVGEIAGVEDFPVISLQDVVIDALFGSGLTRPPEGLAADIIAHVNASGAMVVAIDLPSGLFCDEHTPDVKKSAVIRANYTLTFTPPKIALFFPENGKFTGEWVLLDIGLMQEFIDNTAVRNFMVEMNDARVMLKKRNKFSHKGTFGHALLICGSTGKMGAAVLAARGCLRAGPGLVTVSVPRSGATILQTAVPEAMLVTGEDQDLFTAVPALGKYSSIAIGPGIGTAPETASALKILIQETGIPLILDADAINLIAENKTWLGFLPPGSVFTPHPLEFERLAGKSSDDFERNRMQREFSYKFQCYVVLKGAHTAITTPDGRCFFNTTGNPGMATGGSGDVLTGIIAGLRAQGYSSLESCLLGVYLHGLAGDCASTELGFEAMIADDIVDNLGKSFLQLYGKL